MFKKIDKRLDHKVVKAAFLVSVSVAVILAGALWFTDQQAPTLKDVLSQNGKNGSPDFSLFVASLLALSLATISATRGYETFKRSKPVVKAVLPEKPVATIEQTTEQINEKKMIEGLKNNLKESGKVKAWLQQENVSVKERSASLTAELEEISRAEKMLRKSNVSLSKECERLKSENEMLLLKINSLEIKPKKRAAKKTKTKAKRRIGKKRKSKSKK
ncbi:MAG: hypothetical protein ABIA67_06955 [Candidatus Margulisiibacteriota bacterium]